MWLFYILVWSLTLALAIVMPVIALVIPASRVKLPSARLVSRRRVSS